MSYLLGELLFIITRSFSSFSYQPQPIVSLWGLSDSNSPQVSKSLLNILTDFNVAVVRIVSTRPLISKSSSPCTNPLVTVPKSTNYNWYNRHFNVPPCFPFLGKVEVLISLFAFFQFYFVVSRDDKVHNSASSLFLVDYYEGWSSDRDLVIRLYLKIGEEFVCLILQDRFWVVHVPFIRMVKFQFLAQFQIDHLTYPVKLLLLLLLLLLVTFSWTDSGLYKYHFVVWSNFIFFCVQLLMHHLSRPVESRLVLLLC